MRSVFLLAAFVVSACVSAQLNLTTTHTNYSITFDSSVIGVNNGVFQGAGFTVDPLVGQLNSSGICIAGMSDGNIAFGEDATSGDFARGQSIGGVGTGGIYAFEVEEGDYALGVQPGGSDFTPGEIILKVVNNTGESISEVGLGYDVYIFNDKDRGSNFNFSYSADNVSYSDVSSLDIVTPGSRDTNTQWSKSSESTSFQLNIEDRGCFYLRWTSDDITDHGYRDEIALDNIVVSVERGVPASKEDLIAKTIKLFPNPFIDKISIYSSEDVASVEIINSVGKVVYRCGYFCGDGETLLVEGLTKGIYIAKITGVSGGVFCKKLIKR